MELNATLKWPGGSQPGSYCAGNEFFADTLWSIIAHMDVSTDFEHFVYREAELDAIWSITDSFCERAGFEPMRQVRRLHAGAHKSA